jgi:hypothetical protein
MYNARPALAPVEELADFIATVFFNVHRIAEAHHALLQHYCSVQVHIWLSSQVYDR